MVVKVECDELAYVGIDISSERLDVVTRSKQRSQEPKQYANSVAGRRKLTKELAKTNPRLVVFEPTGGYEREVAKAMCEAGLRCAQVNPKLTCNFSKSWRSNTPKTDAADAAMLAHYAETYDHKIKEYKLPSEVQRALQANSARFAQVQADQVADKVRLATAHESVLKSLRTSIRFHEKQLKALKAEIDALLKQDAALTERAKLLETCVGVGKHTAAMLLANLPEIGELDRKQIASLAGLAPIKQKSGNKEKPAHIGGGRALVRKILYMAAFSAIRHNPIMAKAHADLMARGKLFKVAITAVMRKLLVALNAMVKHNLPWQDRSTKPA